MTAAIPPRADFTAASGNELSLFTELPAWAAQLIADIDAAQNEIVMEMYIFEPDGEGREVADALMRAAGRGVSVRLMVDGLGCETVPSAFFREIEAAGVEFRVYNPLEPWSKWYKPGLPLRRRNHRKLTVIDRRVGHLGGMNLSGRYRDWRDMSLRMAGPVVQCLRASHEAVWSGRYRKFFTAPWRKIRRRDDIVILDNFAGDYYSPVKRYYLAAIKRARSRILLAHGYFFPDKRLRKELRKAARRGVSVEVVTPEDSDIAAVDFAARHLYGRLLRDGIKIHLHQGPMLHVKVAVVDDDWMTLGSANLDPISMFSCLEINAGLVHRPLIEHTVEVIRGYIAESKTIDRTKWKHRPWLEKLLDRLWYRLRRWYAK